MAYREYRPRRELSELVACTWERTVPLAGATTATRVLPDGCVDIVSSSERLFVAGPDLGPFMSAHGAGESLVGLRLRPGVAGRTLDLHASELRNLRVSLDDVWGRAAIELADRIAGAESPSRRRQALEKAVLSRLPEMREPDALVLAATARLGRPGSRVSRLGEALGTSERQLLRRFNAAVGYGPKTLDRVLRFQRFLSRARAVASREEGLARIAAEVGYADQAHLSRECARLAGLTPACLVASSAA
jgi:AraC-like DNA-binding protein